MEAPRDVSRRRISVQGRAFDVVSCAIADNYDDVSAMLSYTANLPIRQDAIICDVGANIGIYSLSYASLYPQARIYAFEPHPDTYDLLMRSVQLNGALAERVHPFNVGLSEAKGRARLSVPVPTQHPRYDPQRNQINCGLFSLHGHGTQRVSCQVTTLDEFVAGHRLPHVEFMKIDVEGHEYEVLKGGERTIRTYRPVLYLEYNELTKALSRYHEDAFEMFFRRHRYRVYGVQYGWARDLKPLPTLAETANVSDLLCVPEEGA